MNYSKSRSNQDSSTSSPLGSGTQVSAAQDSERDPLHETGSILQEFEEQLKDIARNEPRIKAAAQADQQSTEDLQALLEISLGINSTMRLEDTLDNVMKNAIELLGAERGFIMLLDDYGSLQCKTAYNISSKELSGDGLKISNSIATKVAKSGKAIFASDAQDDDRFSDQASIQELHLRSIICVPLKLKQNVIGVIYLDNSLQSKHFLKSDLYVFQLLAGLAASAIHNASLYEHLLDLKSFTENVINKSPVGILVIDSQYQLVSINDAGLAIFDKNKKEVSVVGDSEEPTRFFEFVPDSETSRWRQMIDIAFNTQQSFEDSRYFHNTGYVEKALNIKLSPLSKLPLGGDGLIMALEDITENVILEKYVILSEKLVARGEMAASIGHELNNYLTIINNNAELLERNLKSENFEKVGFNCQRITDNISSMKRFTDGLMDFSKLDSEFLRYDLKHLVEDLLFSLRAQTRFKEILFTTEIDASIPQISIDVGQIQQIFLNLFNNAADALEEREKSERESAEKKGEESKFEKRLGINVRLDARKERIVAEVIDNAMGMTEDTLKNLFRPHFTTKESGHGLGLANCKKIAARHGGELVVESKFGEGTLFRLTLPVNREEPEEQKSKD